MKPFICFLVIVVCFLLGLSACKAKGTPEQTLPSQQQTAQSLTQESRDSSSGQTGGNAVVTAPEGALVLPVRIEVTPDSPQRGDIIKLSLTGVPEGATVSYEWRQNGSLLNESGSSLKLAENFKRGDKVDCRVSVTASGKTDVWTVSTTVANGNPIIEAAATLVKVQDRVYRITFKAKDPDGDTLSYELKDPVDGAVIDKQTGEIQYSVPAGKSGKHAFSVLVSDGNGGDLVYNIAFEIQ